MLVAAAALLFACGDAATVAPVPGTQPADPALPEGGAPQDGSDDGGATPDLGLPASPGTNVSPESSETEAPARGAAQQERPAPADSPDEPVMTPVPGAGGGPGEPLPVNVPEQPGPAGGSGGDEPQVPVDPPDPTAPEDPGDPDEPRDPEPDGEDPIDPAPVDPAPADPEADPTDPPIEEPPRVPEPPPTPPGAVGPGSPEIPNGLASFRLSVIGSSTAAGFGSSLDDLAWVSLLDEALQAEVATTLSTINHAVGGYTALDLAPGSGAPGSIDEALKDQPDLILVALAGSNDLGPGVTAESFVAQLAQLRDTAKAAGIPMFFMSTLPKTIGVNERETLAEWSRAMAQEFDECWIPGPAKPYAPCYIDVFEALADPALGLAAQFDSGDGQHPNDAGHALLFQAVEKIVRPYVCTKTSCRD